MIQNNHARGDASTEYVPHVISANRERSNATASNHALTAGNAIGRTLAHSPRHGLLALLPHLPGRYHTQLLRLREPLLP